MSHPHPTRAALLVALSLSLSLLGACSSTQPTHAQSGPPPVKWTEFVKVQGQSEPVPAQWLQDEEARIAHSLQLPDGVPKTVPYHFGSSPLSDHRKQSIAYFDHLCKTEAGQWIVKTAQNVEGFYFARAQKPPTSDELADLYGPEMPWIQRIFLLTGESLKWQGMEFIQPPLYNYRFVEQPRRETTWQAGIKEPYIRLFGYTTEPSLDPSGKPTGYFKDKTPMQVVGIPKPTAQYGYTWRGIKRPQDREHGIAGGELLIYELQTREVLAVRRQFLITGGNRRNGNKAAWEVAARCPQLPAYSDGGEFTQFAFDVIQTIEPSTTGKK
jgi:hypothetical protein